MLHRNQREFLPDLDLDLEMLVDALYGL